MICSFLFQRCFRSRSASVRMRCSILTLSLLALGCCSAVIQAEDAKPKDWVAEAWKGMEGEWIAYRGGGYAIKRISPQHEVYQSFYLNGEEQGQQSTAMNLSVRSGMLFFSKTDDQGEVVYEGICKLYNDRLYEVNNSFKIDQSGKPNTREYRRLDAPIEQWLRAAREGDVKTLSRMLAEGADPNATAPSSVTALAFAAAAGKLDAIRLLIDKGADVSAQSAWYGTRALVEAAKFGQKDACKLLLELGANIQDGHNFNMTPLHETAFHGRLDTARFLIAEGADLNAKNKNGATPLHIAIYRAGGRNAEVRTGAIAVAKLLIAKGASQELKTKDGKTPLEIAREAKLQEVVQLLEK